ncbi:hypothetical protein LEP1GSC171_0928 [Leptospira santarosai str. HAI1380]|uniref:Uncharacterized protein n=1 Tax=Leptospira santarosai str. ZUN179 TaxID=1049985 RepID=M6UQ74_9LEPT|nr:hypothetical protein LEP1GSC071_1244 [Leptospira santarosai str. JET]EMM85009.1 hypothetical protein LEP1GSC039_0732 [Leptospira santarosai str. 2000027870]EMO12845.1 hypothetical protein LEP1GSC165_2017 [Leptospira santarosai str. CBC523]EMO47292.1 hypothetical protein LEP1GSC187_1901 [Leptospira santarosai str. ZUN179]EMP01672.1 hypothetical protein LEP1GSC171_0928 [Leptospira santarosai str. HAI1380]
MKTVCGSSYIRNRLRLFYAELTLIYKLCGFFVYEVVGVPTWAVLGQTQYCFHTSE